MVAITSYVVPLVAAASASAQIITNIEPVPLFTGNPYHIGEQLMKGNGALYASAKVAPEGSFPIVCAPESRNSSGDPIFQHSRVLCQDANDKSESPKKQVLYVMWPTSPAPARAWELIGFADPDNVPLRSVSQFSWGPGIMMYLEHPAQNIRKAVQWFIAEHGQVLWSVNNDHDGEEESMSIAVKGPYPPHWY